MNLAASPEANYGNWVPKKMIYIPAVLGLAFFAVAYLHWVLLIPLLACFFLAAYFVYARHLFSTHGSNVQNKIWGLVLSNLDWKGNGHALDIGCGNGALSIKLAKTYPSAHVTGIDYWAPNGITLKASAKQTHKRKRR